MSTEETAVARHLSKKIKKKSTTALASGYSGMTGDLLMSPAQVRAQLVHHYSQDPTMVSLLGSLESMVGRWLLLESVAFGDLKYFLALNRLGVSIDPARVVSETA